MTGLKKDQFGGYTRQGKATPTTGGVLAHSYNTHKGTDLYFAFPMGTFIPGELNMGTNTENPTDTHDALTLNAQARSTDLLLYEKFYSDEKDWNFDNMVSYVTGQTVQPSSSLGH